ncbi:Hym1p [Pleurotus ostreatus]|nr:Hym1p [Pleurotus ostreatus]
MVAEYLDKNYDRFFSSYTTLILSNNYVTKRQSLKLLGEILLDRANFNVMTRYIANEANLKMMMNLLRDKSKNIQFEAFHVFKVFVANPKKPPQIEVILRRNKDKLLVFLKNFHNDKEDEQFTVSSLGDDMANVADKVHPLGRETVPYRSDTRSLSDPTPPYPSSYLYLHSIPEAPLNVASIVWLPHLPSFNPFHTVLTVLITILGPALPLERHSVPARVFRISAPTLQPRYRYKFLPMCTLKHNALISTRFAFVDDDKLQKHNYRFKYKG